MVRERESQNQVGVESIPVVENSFVTLEELGMFFEQEELHSEIVGMVDVLKLTYATLDQINSLGAGESEGPAWNKFWLSMDNDSESMMSGDDPSPP